MGYTEKVRENTKRRDIRRRFRENTESWDIRRRSKRILRVGI